MRPARESDTTGLTELLAHAEVSDVVDALVRMRDVGAAVVFRLLDRDRGQLWVTGLHRSRARHGGRGLATR